jgi:hypothetical protein
VFAGVAAAGVGLAVVELLTVFVAVLFAAGAPHPIRNAVSAKSETVETISLSRFCIFYSPFQK